MNHRSLKEISTLLINLRKELCPRTSYNTAGEIATTILLYNPPSSATKTLLDYWSSIKIDLNSRNEFSSCLEFQWLPDMVQHLRGHVVVILGSLSKDEMIMMHQDTILRKKTKMIVNLLPIENGLIAPESYESDSLNMRLYKYSDINCEMRVWSPGKSLSSNNMIVEKALGFNKQPHVCSNNQFRYLWGKLKDYSASDLLPDLEQGKRRVLQRMAGKETVKGSKLSQSAWNEMIEKHLAEGSRDWEIYNHIRIIVTGESIKGEKAQSVAGGSPSTEGDKNKDENPDKEDGRADSLVRATINCIPKLFLPKIHTVLDYGCAEGALTATMAQMLGLPGDRVWGADVRVIPNAGFTFIHLPAELDSPPNVGEILPSLKSGSISLVTAAMVFHHVRHAREAILELRRVISNDGLLVMREHDCISPGTGAYLDIMHGLYSLAWKVPIEWPDFVDEYEAFYRSQSDWTELLRDCGFTLVKEQPHSYTSTNRPINVNRAYYAVYAPTPGFSVPVSVSAPTPVTRNAASGASNPKKRKQDDIQAEGTNSATLEQPLFIRRDHRSSQFHAEDRKDGSVDAVPSLAASSSWRRQQLSLSKVYAAPSASASASSVLAQGSSLNIPSSFQYTLHQSKTKEGQFFKYYPQNGKSEWLLPLPPLHSQRHIK